MSNFGTISPELQSLLAEIRRTMDSRGLSINAMASRVGVSPRYLQSCLAGKKRLAPSRLVLACREVQIGVNVLSKSLDQILGGTSYLRASRAARQYDCSYCGSSIQRGDQYIRLDTFGPTRQSGAPIQYFCRSCGIEASWLAEGRSLSEDQLLLPLSGHIKSTVVQLVDISQTLSEKILTDPNELFTLSPPQFEELVLDRLSAMGLKAQLIGRSTYSRDGGIDIIFTPPRTSPFPFLGAVQVKHHRDQRHKVGPQPLRELMGVMAAQRAFAAGMIVTNTTFTPDAIDFAKNSHGLLRLRDLQDLMRWVADNFTDEAEWREIPSRIQLCKGIFVDIT